MSDLYKLTPEQIARMLDELPDVERQTDPFAGEEDVLGHLPAAEMAVIKHHYGDAAGMDDEQFARFMAACGRKKGGP
jgi:hypothetical protein